MADKKCSNCITYKSMGKDENVVFSAASYERHEARHERREKRLIWIIALLILLLVGSNVGWLIYQSRFEVVEESTTITQDNENGYNNYIGNDGDINYGETNSNN
jgi:hypothetical protein